MQVATKVILNTVVLYAKILVSMAISLVSVPLVLKALGASDYGLYNLIAGIIAMLSFLNSAMTVSSQRYMSVAMGTNDKEHVNIIYNTSFLLHLILGVVIIVILEIGSFFIGRLNIEANRMDVAQIIYQFLILVTFLRVFAVPFDAIINAHEDMIVFSVIELIDSLLMLTLAIWLQYVGGDKLVFYGLGVGLIAILTYFMKYGWTYIAYKSYRIKISKLKNALYLNEMFSFAGWNLFGGLAVVGRNQGVAIIINLFMGTIVNAAYGVANQINGALSQFSSTFQKAINPQLMKSEGMNDRNRLLRVSYISSKFSVLALSFFAIPLIIEMPDVLSIWLGYDIPEFTMELSRCILLMTIAYQYSAGIMSAIQAAGNIRNYQMIMGIILLLNIPLTYFIIKLGYPVYYATIGFVFLEVLSLFVRLRMAKVLIQMPPSAFFHNVIKPTFTIILLAFILCIIPHVFIDSLLPRLISTCLVYVVVFIPLVWVVALDIDQRVLILKRIKKWK